MVGPACVAPRQRGALDDLCHDGKRDVAMQLQRPLWNPNQVLAQCNLAACTKGGLSLHRYDVGQPLTPQASIHCLPGALRRRGQCWGSSGRYREMITCKPSAGAFSNGLQLKRQATMRSLPVGRLSAWQCQVAWRRHVAHRP